MKAVYVQIIDTKSGIYQSGRIEEPVIKGQEIDNALKHFGIISGEVNWLYTFNNIYSLKVGEVVGTSKIVHITTTQVVSDQPSLPGKTIGDYFTSIQQVYYQQTKACLKLCTSK